MLIKMMIYLKHGNEEALTSNIGYLSRAASKVGVHRVQPSFPRRSSAGAKTPKEIIAGLLSTKSNYSPATSKTVLKKLRGLTSVNQLNLICILEEVAFTVNYAITPLSVATSKKDAVLMFFLVRLLEMMVERGPATQLDLKLYGAVLADKIIT